MNAVVPRSPTLSESPSPPPPGTPPLSHTEPLSPTSDVSASNGSKTTRSGLVFPNMESQEQKFLAALQSDRDDIVWDNHKSDGAYWARRNSDPSSPRGLSQTLTNLPDTSALKSRGDAGLSKTLPNLPETSAYLQIRGDLSEMSTRGSYGAQFKGSRTSPRGSRSSQGSLRRRSSLSTLAQMTSSSNSLECVRSSSISSHSHDDLSELNSDGIMSSGEFSEESKSPERSGGACRRQGSKASLCSVDAEKAPEESEAPSGFEYRRQGSEASVCPLNSERSWGKSKSEAPSGFECRRQPSSRQGSKESTGSKASVCSHNSERSWGKSKSPQQSGHIRLEESEAPSGFELRRQGSEASVCSHNSESSWGKSKSEAPSGFQCRRQPSSRQGSKDSTGSKASVCSHNSERSWGKSKSEAPSGFESRRQGSKDSTGSKASVCSHNSDRSWGKSKSLQQSGQHQEDRLRLQHLKEELLTEEADKYSMEQWNMELPLPKRNMPCKTIGARSELCSEIASAGLCPSLAGDVVKQTPASKRSTSLAGNLKKRLSALISLSVASPAKSEPLSAASPAKSKKQPLGIMAKLRSLRSSITDVRIKDLVKLPTKVKPVSMPPRKPVGLNVAQIDAFEHKPVMRHSEYARPWRTRDIVEKVVKPSTLEQLCCYADIVGQELGNGDPQPAEYFVSHSWDMNFGNFVNCLALYIYEPVYTCEGVGPQTTFWIDIFAINQHTVMAGAAVPGSFGENDPFVQVIAQSKGVVLLPANDFKAVGRVWCLYEVLTAINFKRRIVTMFSHDDDMLIQSTNQPKRWMSTSVGQQIVDAESTLARRQFENRLQNAHSCIAALDVYSAQATMPEDRTRILSRIEAMPGGVSKMNDVLKQQLRDGLDNVARMVARCGL